MKFTLKSLILFSVMLIAAALGSALRPTVSMANERPTIDLQAMVPTRFGDWQEQLNQSVQIVDPQQKSVLDKIYSQTLTRSYINSQGYRVMLSIAYGKNQSDALELHKPEICYPAQGFTLLGKQLGTLELSGRNISAMRLATSLGQRFEPITYWTVVGDYITTSGMNKKITELRYALNNRVPDGMLIRVSSVDRDTKNAYSIQSKFAEGLVATIPVAHRSRFGGNAQLN